MSRAINLMLLKAMCLSLALVYPLAFAVDSAISCESGPEGAGEVNFGSDVAFLRKHTDVIVLSGEDGRTGVALVPAWQGRIVVSTADGDCGRSFGWINRELIASGEVQPHINAFGGADRFWLGPEGSQFSIYFAPGERFEPANWFVPAPLDTEPFRTVEHTEDRALFEAEFSVTNYAGNSFRAGVEREARLLSTAAAWDHLGRQPARGISIVAYESNNTLTNAGEHAWTKDTGLLSIWIAGMFDASPSTTVVVPIRAGQESELGPEVTVYDAYGAQPAERLYATDDAVFYRGDAQFQGKIGVSPRRSVGRMGSYDASAGVLTLVQFDQTPGVTDYVNSLWGVQERPYDGDSINSYNDGPPAPGVEPYGAFYELESSSPAAALAPGEGLQHTHRTFHLTGSQEELDAIALEFLGVGLAQIASALPRS